MRSRRHTTPTLAERRRALLGGNQTGEVRRSLSGLGAHDPRHRRQPEESTEVLQRFLPEQFRIVSGGKLRIELVEERALRAAELVEGPDPAGVTAADVLEALEDLIQKLKDAGMMEVR